MGSFIQDNIEVEYFSGCDLGNKYNLQNLMETIIQKKYNVGKQLEEFIDNDDWQSTFNKIGIMNDSVAKMCEKVSLKIRP